MGLFDKIKDLLSSDKKEQNTADHTLPSDPNAGSMINENRNVDENSLVDKASDFIASTVDEVKEQGSQLWDQVKEKAVDLNESTREYREKLAEKAKDTLEKIDDFVDQTVEKANKLAEEEKRLDADKDGLADQPINFGKSVNESREDFFTKAEDWLKKNETNEIHSSQSNPSSDVSSNHKIIKPLELPKDTE